MREEEKSSHKHKSDCRQCPDCPLSSRYRSSRELHTAEPKKKKVLFSGPKPFQDLGCIFFFICSRWRASSHSNPKEPTSTPNSSQCPDQGYCTIHRWPFFIYSKKFRLLLTLPPSCPFLRTLQYQRDWRKKKAKNELYTPPYSYKDAVLDSSGGREIGFFFMTPPALAELQVAAAAAAVAALVMVVVTPYFHSLRH